MKLSYLLPVVFVMVSLLLFFFGVNDAYAEPFIQTKLTASDAAANDHFGHSVSVHDDLVAVGARYNDDGGSNSGSAYVYEKVNGVWTETKLTASDAAANDHFGHSVSVHDDLVAVGARYNDDNGSASGSAYVYEKVNGVWTETKLTASDAAAGDYFGYSVSVHDDLVAVGAHFNDDNGSDSGSAYVYEKVNGVWTETKLTASDAAKNDHFGFSVSVHDDLVAVGARYNDDGGSNSGSAYVYEKVNGVWTETKLTASDAAAGDWFSNSVSVHDDLVAVGARYNDDNGSNSGSAYVYEKVNGVWTETKLTASDAAANDYFGNSVSVHDDLVAVGAHYNDDNGSNSGSAYVYEKVNGVWTETKLTASDAAADDYFGHSVSVHDDLVAVGAFYNDDGGSNSGSAYVYETISNYFVKHDLFYNAKRLTHNSTTDKILFVIIKQKNLPFSLSCKHFTQSSEQWNNQTDTTLYDATFLTKHTSYIRCYDESEKILFTQTVYKPFGITSGFDLINESFGNDGLFGVPFPFLIILIVASIWTGRNAQVGVIVTGATIGIMGILGLFALSAEVWAMIVLLIAVGMFLGKKIF